MAEARSPGGLATDGPTDAELLTRHVAGDASAFGVIVERHRDRMWAVALRTLGDHEEAADAVQDAFLSAYRAAASAQFRGEAAVTTWLHRIVVNACLDRVRRAAVRPTVMLPEDDGGNVVLAFGRDETSRQDDTTDVRAALATLPLEQRAVLVLVDMEGWPVAEVAALLGVPTGTVKSRCARARARLLPILAPGRVADGGTGRTATASNLVHDHPTPDLSSSEGSAL